MELREEKRHRVRPESDRGDEDLAASINKTTDRIQKSLWMKWSVTIVGLLLSILLWFAKDYAVRVLNQVDTTPAVAKAYTDMAIAQQERELAVYMEQIRELQREQKRTSRTVDRMAVFFETRFGMPRDARAARRADQDEEN